MAGVGGWYQAGHCQDIDGFLLHLPGHCRGAVMNCDGNCCGPKEKLMLTQSERATYQSLVARGFPHDVAIDAAMDGVDVDHIRMVNLRAEDFLGKD